MSIGCRGFFYIFRRKKFRKLADLFIDRHVTNPRTYPPFRPGWGWTCVGLGSLL